MIPSNNLRTMLTLTISGGFKTKKSTVAMTCIVPRSEERVGLRVGSEDYALFANLGVVLRLLRHSWCPHRQASLNEETKKRIKMTPEKDQDPDNLNVIHKFILPYR